MNIKDMGNHLVCMQEFLVLGLLIQGINLLNVRMCDGL
jgi:hypothetical protein